MAVTFNNVKSRITVVFICRRIIAISHLTAYSSNVLLKFWLNDKLEYKLKKHLISQHIVLK